jgi:hypothetical protein
MQLIYSLILSIVIFVIYINLQIKNRHDEKDEFEMLTFQNCIGFIFLYIFVTVSMIFINGFFSESKTSPENSSYTATFGGKSNNRPSNLDLRKEYETTLNRIRKIPEDIHTGFSIPDATSDAY